MAEFVITTLAAVGLSMAAQALMAKKPKSDRTPPTLTDRGQWIPLVIGHHIVAPAIGWVGGRYTSGTDNWMGQETTKNYREFAWHQLCVGPVDELWAIRESGRNIIEPTVPMLPADWPNGTLRDVGGRGMFKMYWGSPTQPVNPDLASALQCDANWGHRAYVWWCPKKMDSSPLWPELLYQVCCKSGHSPLTQSSSWLENGTSRGVNPAHAMAQLLTAKWPRGAGLDPEDIDCDTLEALGVLCEQEHIHVNMACRDAMQAMVAVGQVLQDVGVMMPQVGRRLAFISVRKSTGALPQFSDDILMPSRPERTRLYGPRSTNQLYFTWSEQSTAYKTGGPIIKSHDGDAIGRPQIKEVEIPTATYKDVAAKIADRREHEELGDVSPMVLEAQRQARLLLPGNVFTHPSLGQMRVWAVEPVVNSARVKLSVMPDFFAVDPTGVEPDPIPDDPSDTPAAPDLAFDFTEATEAGDSLLSINVWRIRSVATVLGSGIWASVGGGAYQRLGNQDVEATGGTTTTILKSGVVAVTSVTKNTKTISVAGTGLGFATGDWVTLEATSDPLQDGFDATVASVTEGGGNTSIVVNETIPGANSTGGVLTQTMASYGPTFTGLGTDQASVSDLSSDQPNWQAGAQLALLSSGSGQEIVYLRQITSTGVNTWQARGLIRGTRGTSNMEHPIGAKLYIIKSQDLQKLSHAVLAVGSVSVKSAPYDLWTTVSLADVTAVTRTLTGAGGETNGEQGGPAGGDGADNTAAEEWDWYVSTTGNDNGTGKVGSPFQTITKAISVARAGDAVLVMDGTYNEELNFAWSGTSTARIRFYAQHNGGVIVDAQNTRAKCASGNGQWIKIVGFTFRNARHALQNDMVVTATGWLLDHCTFRNADAVGCSIHGDQVTLLYCLAEYNGQCGINGSYASNVLVKGCVTRYNNNGKADPAWKNDQYSVLKNGLYYADPGWEAGGGKYVGCSTVTVDGMEAYENIGSGIWFDYQSTSVTVRYCNAHDNSGLNPGVDDWAGGGIGVELQSTGPFTVQNNTASNNTGPGIMLNCCRNVSVTGNTLTGNALILASDPNRGAQFQILNVSITGNTVVNSFIGTWDGTWDVAATEARNVVVSGTTFTNPTPAAFVWNSVNYSEAQMTATYGFD